MPEEAVIFERCNGITLHLLCGGQVSPAPGHPAHLPGWAACLDHCHQSELRHGNFTHFHRTCWSLVKAEQHGHGAPKRAHGLPGQSYSSETLWRHLNRQSHFAMAQYTAACGDGVFHLVGPPIPSLLSQETVTIVWKNQKNKSGSCWSHCLHTSERQRLKTITLAYLPHPIQTLEWILLLGTYSYIQMFKTINKFTL